MQFYFYLISFCQDEQEDVEDEDAKRGRWNANHSYTLNLFMKKYFRRSFFLPFQIWYSYCFFSQFMDGDEKLDTDTMAAVDMDALMDVNMGMDAALLSVSV